MAPKQNDPDAYALQNAPRSLLVGANRIHFDRVVELVINIRRDCDATAAELGYTSEHDGLAVVIFLAEALLNAVRQERDEQQAPPQPPRRKSGPHEDTKQFLANWSTIYPPVKEALRASPATIATWIAALDENLRLGKTNTGKNISAHKAVAIRAYRAALDRRRAALESGKIKRPTPTQIRENLSEAFVKTGRYGQPGGSQDAYTYIKEKEKRARRSVGKATKRAK